MQKLILASGSPRRWVILDCMGLPYQVIPSSFVEWLDDLQDAKAVAAQLGLGKAKDVARMHPDAFVIGSDTIVTIDGRQVAKPADAAEAKQMLQQISGRTHQVITSVAVVCQSKSIFDVEVASSNITFATIPRSTMDSYIATGDPYDKAGGYAKQHPLLSPLVTSIEGDPFTVTGLPFALLGRMLSRHGIHVPRTNQQIAKLYYQTDLSSQNIIQ